MLNFTVDPNIIIVYQKEDLIIYCDLTVNKLWLIFGKCSLCGECIDGAINPDLRPYNERLDNPTRPEIKNENCSLRGVYLNGD